MSHVSEYILTESLHREALVGFVQLSVYIVKLQKIRPCGLISIF